MRFLGILFLFQFLFLHENGGIRAAEIQTASLYELRVLQAFPARKVELLERVQGADLAAFRRHGITLVGLWEDATVESGKVYFLVSYPDEAHRIESWRSLLKDEEWLEAYRASRADGPVVESVTSVLLRREWMGPLANPSEPEASDRRLFELRVLQSREGRHQALVSRIENHEFRLLARRGVHPVGLWLPEASETLQRSVYMLLAHDSPERSAESYASFSRDPEWLAVLESSEKQGPLVGNTRTVFLRALPFSPLH